MITHRLSSHDLWPSAPHGGRSARPASPSRHSRCRATAPVAVVAFSIFHFLFSISPTHAADSALTFHAPPRPLSPDAVTAPWPRFLGPNDDGTTPEAPLLDTFPETGPPLVWERARGTGYAGVALAEGRLFHFHRVGDQETLECVDPETGAQQWLHESPVEYRDRYGYSNGPRTAPVLDGPRVYTLGVTGLLQCLDTTSGKLLWKKDLRADFAAPLNFFGIGSSPLVHGDKLILSVGGQSSIVALHKETGKIIWKSAQVYDAGYASPTIATIHGKERLLLYTGGESRPTLGGLLLADPATGVILDDFPWRAEVYESVTASTARFIPPDRVYISECYEHGGVMLQVTEDDKFKIAWKAPDFGMHWTTPQVHGDHLYGFPGRNEPDASFTCIRISDGETRFSDPLTWKKPFGDRSFGWGYYRANILRTGAAESPRWLVLGEMGDLAFFDLSPKGFKELSRASLFTARHAWAMPAIHRGLLYVQQNEPGLTGDTKRRLLCYDLRGE